MKLTSEQSPAQEVATNTRKGAATTAAFPLLAFPLQCVCAQNKSKKENAREISSIHWFILQQGQCQAKAGARNSTLISHMSVRDPSTWAFLWCVIWELDQV